MNGSCSWAKHIKKRGLAKYVGVCNHDVELLRELGDVQPDVVQVEFNPCAYQTDLLSYCKATGVHVHTLKRDAFISFQNHSVLFQL